MHLIPRNLSKNMHANKTEQLKLLLLILQKDDIDDG